MAAEGAISLGGTLKLGRPGTGDAEFQAQAQTGCEVQRRLSNIEAELSKLREVPWQLGKVLDVLEKILAERSHKGPGSSIMEERQRTRADSMSSDASIRQTATRPLIGQRRPSTQSDDPRAMAISRERRIPGMDILQTEPVAHKPMETVCTPSRQRRMSAPTVGYMEPVMQPVMLNSMPEEEPELDVETMACADTQKQIFPWTEPDTPLHDLEKGDSSPVAVLPRHRESITSSFSLGGDSRQHSIECTRLMILGQENEGLGVEKWFLHPSSCVRLSWDVCMMVLAIVVGTVVSVALCYHGDDLSTDFSYVVFLNVVSGVWWLDIGLNFCTGFHQSGRIVRCPREVARRYLHSWLVPDLLSVLPLVTPSAAVTRVLSGLKLVRVLHLGPLLAGRHQDHRLLGLPARVGVMVLIITMAMTCLWRLTLHADQVRGMEVPDPSVEWWELFMTDMYWVAMTMSTVGFGDIAPVGTFSRLFAILAMLVAPIFFGTIVSLLTHVTQSIVNDEIEMQVAEASRFMRLRRLPAELQRRVQHNLRNQIRQERLTLKPALFTKLSTAMQREISLELLRSSVLNFPLFRGVLHSFIAEIAQAHTWVQCLTGDLVVEEGQLIEEIVFVIRGRMQMHVRLEDMQEQEDDTDQSFDSSRLSREFELGAGAWFSEAALFFSDRVRTFTVYAAADSELAVLLSSDYHRILQKYPRQLKRHQVIAKALLLGQLSQKDLAYREPMEPPPQKTWRVPRSPWDWFRRPRSGPLGGH